MNVELDYEVLVIGAGISGIAMGIALRAAGRDFRIIEKAEDIGGTWRDNRYPGVACDVPSHLYSYSFEPNPYWSRAYAPGDEIQDYLLYVVEKYQLRPHIDFETYLQSADYDPADAVWRVTVAGLDGQPRDLVVRDVVLGVGSLHEPSMPSIPGLHEFAGEIMHTSSWVPGTTAWDKQVAVIGTGASAVQAIPPLAEDAAHLTVFQRTPVWVMPKNDTVYSDKVIDSFEKHPSLLAAQRARIRATNETRVLAFTSHPKLLAAMSQVAKRHLRQAVKDKRLREKLTPSYTMGCKRIPLSNDYYPALARDNVDVVTDDIVAADQTGLVTADGTHHDIDLLVLATGFDPAGSFRHLPVTGLDGHDFVGDFAAGIQTYYGVTVPHYPNLFMLLGPNTVLGHTSVILMIEAQVRLIMTLLAERDRRGSTAVGVRAQIVPAHMAELQARTDKSVWVQGGCHSWYLDENGVNRVLWPGSVGDYEKAMTRPELIDYEFTGGRAPSRADR